MGSKARHAKEILSVILSYRRPGQFYTEPFVGGANVIHLVDGPRMGRDKNAYLISLFQAIQKGWIPPESVSESEYQTIRKNPSDFPAELVAFVGIGCSYSGKWFGGYARGNGKQGPRNYARESRDNILAQAKGLQGVVFSSGSYDAMEIPAKSLIYCDPPYRGTTGYKDAFDSDEFWGWCDFMSLFGHTVFVSEYSAPASWKCVWEKQVFNTLEKNTGSKVGIERLFALESK